MCHVSKPVPARVHILQARAAPVAVIIKRGPSKSFHIVRWDLKTDEIEHGSWFHGRIYERRSDLSFDGKWMVYFAVGPTKEYWSWTAVCKPPWLRALALWPWTDTWYGGGVFVGPNQLVISMLPDSQATIFEEPEIDFSYKLSPYGWGSDIYLLRLERDGWKMKSDPGTNWMQQGSWTKASDYGLTLTCRYLGYSWNGPGGGAIFRYEVRHPNGATPVDLSQATWADWDFYNRLIIAQGGMIYRYSREDLEVGSCSFRLDANEWKPPQTNDGPSST